MRCVDLIDEAKFRGLELYCQEKSYLVEVLLIDDEAYAELMSKLGNHVEAIEFAQGEVAYHNQGLRQQRAAAEAAREQATRESHKKQQETRAKTEQIAPGKVEEQAKGKKRAHQSDEDEEAKANKKKKPSSSRVTTEVITPMVRDDMPVKKVKRARPSDGQEEAEPRKKKKSSSTKDTAKASAPIVKDGMPVKKAKRAQIAKANPPPTALPRAMQARTDKKSSAEKKYVKMTDKKESAFANPVKGVAVKVTRKKASTPEPAYSRRLTRSTYKESEDKRMENVDEESEEDTDEGDFIEDDLAHKPKRKSEVGAMVRSNLFAGMR